MTFIYTAMLSGLFGYCPGSPVLADDNEAVKAQNIVVAATRNDMDAREAPGAISIITRQDIEKTNSRDIVELLREQTGVVLKGRIAEGRKTITFRGLNDKHTLMPVDKMRISASNTPSAIPAWKTIGCP